MVDKDKQDKQASSKQQSVAPKSSKSSKSQSKTKSKKTSSLVSSTSSTPSTTIESSTSKNRSKKDKSKINRNGEQQQEKKPNKPRRVRYSEKDSKVDNKNVPREARLAIVEDKDDEADKCDFESLFTEQVRHHFTYENLKPLAGSPYDPEQFLKPAKGKVPYLDREVDPRKLYIYMVNYMNSYYDMSKDKDPNSQERQTMDDLLWDTLACIIPLLCRQVVAESLSKEPLIVSTHPNAIVFGDIHGNFNDIWYIYKHFFAKAEFDDFRFVFLGDYVDRGPKSTEVVIFLLVCKLLHPQRFVLLRGNHEVEKVNRKYGFMTLIGFIFQQSCIKDINMAKLIYQSFIIAFNHLPVGAVIKNGDQKGIFCCHGGIPSSSLKDTEQHKAWSIAQLNSLSAKLKPNSLVPSKNASKSVLALNEILWNDPLPRRVRNDPRLKSKLFYRNVKRGGHCHWFTESALSIFLEDNHLRLAIRGHQYKYSKDKGFGIDCDGHLLTLFSSSNYCGTEQNVTGYAVVTTDFKVIPRSLRTLEESAPYRKFNFFEIKVDEATDQVTDVYM